MSGRVGDLSPKQAEALEQVRFAIILIILIVLYAVSLFTIISLSCFPNDCYIITCLVPLANKPPFFKRCIHICFLNVKTIH